MNVDRVIEPASAAADPHELVSEPERLPQLLELLAGEGAVAMDTEFMREDTCFARLALVQLGCAGRVFLLDPVLLGAALDRRLPEALALAVLHSPGEDYGVLMHVLGAAPARTFDTQAAAPFAGLAANLGLRELLRQVLGIELNKDQTRSDWLKRPLTPEQLRYAADDVRYLLPLHAALGERIAARGQASWCEDECRRLRAIGVDEAPDPQPHWQFRRGDELPEAAQRRLYQLLHWREQRARESDRPRNWIAPPALLWSLAERNPQTAAEVERQLAELKLGGGSRRASTLLAALAADRTELLTKFQPAPAAIVGAAKLRFQQLRHHAEQQAQQHGLPVEVLAPRRLLEPLARDRRWPVQFQGWREEALALPAGTLA
jgi:ribonuclease D